MYWYRDGSALSILPWLGVMALAWLGGWLLASHAFRLERRERLIVGFGLGLVLYTFLANLLGHFLSPVLTFALPGLLVLLLGLAAGARRETGRPWLDKNDLGIWPWLVVGLGLIWLFMLWGKGLAIFDEQKNLSLISIMANGDIPPHHTPGQPLLFIYHYGFQLFAASLMQLGGLFPWSAFDAAKAILWGPTLLLAGLLGARYIGKAWGPWAAGALLALGSGTRWLLFLLPPGLLLQADNSVTLIGTSALVDLPFSQALASGWTIDGGPPLPYIFGFLNGLIDPLVLAHQGPNTLSILILLLVWLLATRLKKGLGWIVLGAVLAFWALAWEATYALFILGLFAFAALYYLKKRNLDLPHLKAVLYAALISAPIALLQGGTLTEMARQILFEVEGEPVSRLLGSGLGLGLSTVGLAPLADGILGFGLRWPPAVLSAHLGSLSLASPIQLLVALFEIGPVLLFTPWLTRWAWRRARAGDWPLGVLAVTAWIGFLMPIILTYEADRDISRLSWQALLTWNLLLLFVVADPAFRWRDWLRKAAVVALVLICVSGLVITGTQLTAANRTQLAHGYTELDAAILAQVWGTIHQDERVFGPLGYTTIITGHLTGQLLGAPPMRDVWSQIPEISIDFFGFLSNYNWDYIYLDNRWLLELYPEMENYSPPACVEIVAEVWDNSQVNFRQLLDLRPCRD